MRKSIIPVIHATLFCMALLTMASCATKKEISGIDGISTGKTADGHLSSLAFVQRVFNNQVYAQNIVGKMTFNLKTGDKDISVPGALHMRKDKVIRIQLFIPLLGTEVGRLEFTPSYVLILDRLHKEYMKADYNQLDFLRDNGLNFYSLQALFWNQLFMPGKTSVSDGMLDQYDVALDAEGTCLPVTVKNGNMTYQWRASKAEARIEAADITYRSTQHGTSSLNWNYGDFRTVGSQLFPALQSFTFNMNTGNKKQTATVSIAMDGVSNDSKWNTDTTISDKYKKVETKDVFTKIMSM